MPRSWVYASIAFLIPLAGSVNAQPASFHGPIAGFAYARASRSVRPLLGVPGAAWIGPPVLSEVDWASIAPGGRWAVLIKGGGASFMRGLSDLAPTEAPVDGLIDAVDRVVWSRDGSFAILYSSSGGQLQRVRLSDRPQSGYGVVGTCPADCAEAVSEPKLLRRRGSQSPCSLVNGMRFLVSAERR
jgi:hypothetical protein